MSISKFFENVLEARFTNVRWSWGSTDPAGRVFLRVWDDQIRSEADGRYALVARNRAPSSKPGSTERHKHIASLRAGAEGFGVICTATDPQATPRSIARFRKDIVLRFGELRDLDDGIFARIVEELPATALVTGRATPHSIPTDTERIRNEPTLDETTREALVQARIGQGRFRTEVLGLWDQRCAVTGSRLVAAIRASHIQPWRHSTNEQRLDPENGLPLVANLDALFDAGLISFDAGGALLMSPVMSRQEIELFDLEDKRLRRPPSRVTQQYLGYHRDNILLQ
jgi:hypothetical protein